jgi:hypothetical protein
LDNGASERSVSLKSRHLSWCSPKELVSLYFFAFLKALGSDAIYFVVAEHTAKVSMKGLKNKNEQDL